MVGATHLASIRQPCLLLVHGGGMQGESAEICKCGKCFFVVVIKVALVAFVDQRGNPDNILRHRPHAQQANTAGTATNDPPSMSKVAHMRVKVRFGFGFGLGLGLRFG